MSYPSYNMRGYRYARTCIVLPRVDDLPMIHCVRRLSLGQWRRQPDPSVQLEIAAHMVGLTESGLMLNERRTEYPTLLREERQSLTEDLAVHSEQTKYVVHAALTIPLNSDPFIRQMALPNLTYPRGYDLLGSALRKWSQRLSSLRVQGVLDGALFWPQPQETDNDGAADEPEWQYLQDLDVRLGRNTPSGWWYFMPEGDSTYGRPPRDPAVDPKDQPPLLRDKEPNGPPESFIENMYYDSDEYDAERRLRNVPHEGMMQPLMEAWAKALGRMPAVRTARLRLQSYEGEWEVVNEAPGYTSTVWYGVLASEEQEYSRLIFHNTGGWRPAEKTMDLLLAIGSVRWLSTPMTVLAAKFNRNVTDIGT